MNYLTDTDPSDIPPEINRVIALSILLMPPLFAWFKSTAY